MNNVEEKHDYECTLVIKVNPTRQARNQREFVDNLLEEYNSVCGNLFCIEKEDLQNITFFDHDGATK